MLQLERAIALYVWTLLPCVSLVKSFFVNLLMQHLDRVPGVGECNETQVTVWIPCYNEQLQLVFCVDHARQRSLP